MYDRQPFAEFLRELRWYQGEHVLIAAPTRTGKTTLAEQLLKRRTAVCCLVSKTADVTFDKTFLDYTRAYDWPGPRDAHKILLWPKRQKTLVDKVEYQRVIFKRALDAIGTQRGWCVMVDEFHWLSQFLRLDREDAILQHEGSGAATTVVNLTQRPAWIPQISYSSATHAFIGKTSHKDDLKKLSDFGSTDAKSVIETIQAMGRHDLLYINPMGDMVPRVINTRQ